MQEVFVDCQHAYIGEERNKKAAETANKPPKGAKSDKKCKADSDDKEPDYCQYYKDNSCADKAHTHKQSKIKLTLINNPIAIFSINLSKQTTIANRKVTRSGRNKNLTAASMPSNKVVEPRRRSLQLSMLNEIQSWRRFLEGSSRSNLNSNENYTPTTSSPDFKLVPATDFSYLNYVPNVNDSIGQH